MLAAAGSLDGPTARRLTDSGAQDGRDPRQRPGGPRHPGQGRCEHAPQRLPAAAAGDHAPSLEAFDPSSRRWSPGSRQITTVPGQALYLLNSPFVRTAITGAGQRSSSTRTATDEDRIRALYRLVLGRLPKAGEIERAAAFLAEYQAAQAEPDAAASSVPQVASAAEPRSPAKPKPQPENPDEVDQTDEPIVEHVVRASDARTAAWLALAQALFGSAEFRYVR